MKKEMVLQEGELVCDKCEGTGESGSTWRVCGKCLGEGKVDWIENAMGGKKPPNFTFSGTSGIGSSSIVYKNIKLDVKDDELTISSKPIDKHIQEVVIGYLTKKIEKILFEKIGNIYNI